MVIAVFGFFKLADRLVGRICDTRSIDILMCKILKLEFRCL